MEFFHFLFLKNNNFTIPTINPKNNPDIIPMIDFIPNTIPTSQCDGNLRIIETKIDVIKKVLR